MITKVYERSPKTCFEVFIHKVDGDLFLSEENKSDCQTEIQSKITEEIYDTCPSAHITFHCTSIFPIPDYATDYRSFFYLTTSAFFRLELEVIFSAMSKRNAWEKIEY